MKYPILLIFTACAFIMTGCYLKVDPALIYTGSNEVTPDTITEAGRAINENIASRMKERLDSSFIDYIVVSTTGFTKEIAGGSLKFVYMAGIYTDINRIVVGLEKCSPRNIYRFKKHITASDAIMFEEVAAVSI